MSISGKHEDQYNYRVVPEVQPIGNPAPLGLAAFGLTAFVLSVYNAGLGHGWQQKGNVIVGMALFYGGLSQFLAGMWAFRAGATFAATVFSSYSAFWFSYATIFIPSSGIIDAYINSETGVLEADELNTTLGVYLLAWTFLSFIFLMCSLRQNVAFIVLFGLLTLHFLLLAVSRFSPNSARNSQIAGGYVGILASTVAVYLAVANLATKENTFFTLPVGAIGPALKNRKSESEV